MSATSKAKYGIHEAHDAAAAANKLRHLIRRLAEDETHPDPVGLGTLVGVADVLADGLDRYWWALRPRLEPPDA